MAATALEPGWPWRPAQPSILPGSRSTGRSRLSTDAPQWRRRDQPAIPRNTIIRLVGREWTDGD
jgi:hypothetical protein